MFPNFPKIYFRGSRKTGKYLPRPLLPAPCIILHVCRYLHRCLERTFAHAFGLPTSMYYLQPRPDHFVDDVEHAYC